MGNNPYADYLYNLDRNGTGYFQTYTFNHDQNSLVRFLDNARKIESGSMGNSDDVFKQLTGEAKMMLGLQKQPEYSDPTDGEDVEEIYTPPAKRSLGRPHMTGWLDWLE